MADGSPVARGPPVRPSSGSPAGPTRSWPPLQAWASNSDDAILVWPRQCGWVVLGWITGGAPGVVQVAGWDAMSSLLRDEAHAHRRQRRLDAVLGRELGLDVGDKDRGGLLADEEPLRDLPVGAALADEGQDLDLPAGQGRATRVKRTVRVVGEVDGVHRTERCRQRDSCWDGPWSHGSAQAPGPVAVPGAVQAQQFEVE
jgi:hypothetical protein